MPDSKNVAKGAAAGLLAGLAASWVMNEFQAAVSKVRGQSGGQSSDEPATVKAAEAATWTFAHHELPDDAKAAGGEIAHYAMGALSGALYGVVAETTPAASSGWGTSFGAALWLIADEVTVPALGFAKGPSAYPLSSHANAFASHIVYGVATDLIRRGLRRVL